MFNFVKADLYKNSYSKIIYLIFLISTFTAVIIAFVSSGIASGDVGRDVGVNLSLMSDSILTAIFGGVLIGELIVDDFESKSVHNEIVSGKGRFSIVIGKLVAFSLLFLIPLLPYAIVVISCLAKGGSYAELKGIPSPFFDLLAKSSANDISLKKVIILCLAIIFMYIARLSICIPFAFKFRKKIPVLIVGFSTSFIFDIIFSVVKDSEVAADFFKLLPYYRITTITADASLNTVASALISGGAYILIMVIITSFSFRKAEIK